MAMDLQAARNLVQGALARMEAEMADFGSALSGHAVSELVIVDDWTRELEFGWVFFYESRRYLISGNFSDRLVGNSPLIVDRDTGELIATGTAKPVEEYISEYAARR